MTIAIYIFKTHPPPPTHTHTHTLHTPHTPHTHTLVSQFKMYILHMVHYMCVYRILKSDMQLFQLVLGPAISENLTFKTFSVSSVYIVFLADNQTRILKSES